MGLEKRGSAFESRNGGPGAHCKKKGAARVAAPFFHRSSRSALI